MNIKKDRDQVVYYYKDIEDLKTYEKEFQQLWIRLDMFQNDPVRICPRNNNGQEIWYVLLLNTGDKNRDLETLRSALSRFNRDFIGEL